MFIKSCIAHLCHLPGFDQVVTPLGTSWGPFGGCWGLGSVRGVLGASRESNTKGAEGVWGHQGVLGPARGCRGHLG